MYIDGIRPAGFGILFGRAQGIDFLNLDRGDSAFVAIDIFDLLKKIDPDRISNEASSYFTGIESDDPFKDATQMQVSSRCNWLTTNVILLRVHFPHFKYNIFFFRRRKMSVSTM
jgi:hypothetical protein